MRLVKCYIWSIAVYGAENWTLQRIGRKYLESSEMWCWRRSVGLIMWEMKKYYT